MFNDREVIAEIVSTKKKREEQFSESVHWYIGAF